MLARRVVVWSLGASLAGACVGDEARLIEQGSGGAASCPIGSTACGDQCVDLELHPDHCGACDTPCPEGELCSLGACDVECLGGTKQCGTVCVDVGVDPQNCGDCGITCSPNQSCRNGSCGTPSSCLDIITSGTSLGDGVYTIDPTGGDTSDARVVYCDMTTDGGGWTLVGRSIAGPAAPGCAPDGGILLEGAGFLPSSAPASCASIQSSAQLGIACSDGCGVMCTLGHLDYALPTTPGTSYTLRPKIADYLHNCVNPISMHAEADGGVIGSWVGTGSNGWVSPSFGFTASADSTAIGLFLDDDFCCGCSMTCSTTCSPLSGDANLYVDELSVTPSAAISFGWSGASGALDADGAPYSLGAATSGLAFSEILFGAHASGKSWGEPIYRLTVGADFATAHARDAFDAGAAVSVAGSCPDGPANLSWAGFTSDTDAFHLSADGSNAFGLTPYGWRTCHDDCARGGELNGKPGMIFVR